jgi:putative spermidine/putrescine transport system permease protein
LKSNRLNTWLYRHSGARAALLLVLPVLWLAIAYLGSLGVMLVSSLWSVDSFTGNIVHQFSLSNFHQLISQKVYSAIAIRSISVAVIVTIIDGLLAIPIAIFIAKVLRPRFRSVVIALVLVPLWASYLVKTYAWRSMFSDGGVISWAFKPLKHLGISSPGFGLAATTITLAYLWLPYMILPIYAGLERLPNSLLEASSDLGAPAFTTFKSIILPIIYPAIIAGSIFTFSLSLGDYIVVKIVGGTSQLVANVIADNVGTAGNLPFAAAMALLPIITILGYLFAVRRSGALENF